MGLDTTHNCWHGAYSAFMEWRIKIAHLAGFPPLELMEGFWEGSHLQEVFGMTNFCRGSFERLMERLPIKWDNYEENPLTILLRHSDCEGIICYDDAPYIARELEKLLLQMKTIPDQNGHIGNWHQKTSQFIKGLRLASTMKENIEFH